MSEGPRKRERASLAEEVLDGLRPGYHYSTLVQWHGTPIEVAWNYDKEPGELWRNDDFTDRINSKKRRALAIDYQERIGGAAIDDPDA